MKSAILFYFYISYLWHGYWRWSWNKNNYTTTWLRMFIFYALDYTHTHSFSLARTHAHTTTHTGAPPTHQHQHTAVTYQVVKYPFVSYRVRGCSTRLHCSTDLFYFLAGLYSKPGGTCTDRFSTAGFWLITMKILNWAQVLRFLLSLSCP